MTVTVEATVPARCTCRCGCGYQIIARASIAEAMCFSCRHELHAGRREGWRPGDPIARDNDPEPRHG